MDEKKILEFCLENGVLLDKEALGLLGGIKDLESIKLIIEKIHNQTHQKIMTKDFFYENKHIIKEFFLTLPERNQKYLEELKIKLGLSIEISKKRDIIYENKLTQFDNNVKILSEFPVFNKKPEIGDFVKNFRNKFSELRKILQEHSELKNLVSIDKISGERKGISLIGIVYDKRVTKNKNILFDVEDLTGRIKILISKNKPELYEKAEEISMDSVIGFSGSGSWEIFFANDVVFPDAMLFERKRSPVEENVLFLGDIHFGSKRFLEKSFLKFIDYLNGKIPNTPEVDRIKYIFVVGDVITGIGNYPNQEKDLKINDLEEQFLGIADLFKKIKKDVKIIISPGNHDCVRIMEPQPVFDEKYAWPLYDMDNVFLTGNPAEVNIGAMKDFSGFNVLTYHGFSYPFYAGNVPSLLKKRAMNCPDEIMKYLLKSRHLAPSHASTQYFPLEQDGLTIRNVPDFFVSAHTHKSAVSYYNNIFVVSTSCWESMSSYQEKFGNKPDHCKVPMVNLKTRAVKVLDFEEGGDENRN